MFSSLRDKRIDEVLLARPTTTVTSGGVRIPYPFPSPADWRDHWIYFLLIDRFNHPIAAPRFPEPCGLYQGGTFAGVQQRLPYLKELGAGAIWLSPVLMNPGWFEDYWGGYGTFDFLRIEPRFCSDPAAAAQDPAIAEAEFRGLVDEAHAQGMYVILDIVLNHVGDLFNYEGMQDALPWRNEGEYSVYWRDGSGAARGSWTRIEDVEALPRDAGVWPKELQHNDYFRRKGTFDASPDLTRGDFSSFKELVTEYLDTEHGTFPVRDLLIRAYQYLIARFDLDGFRIDTLQYVEPDFARVFGNAMREYALSIGKKNFFTFGEVWQENDEDEIASFVGRDTSKDGELVGVDAAIDFPLWKRLVQVVKGFMPPAELALHFDSRRKTLKYVVSSHGEASGYYVTFLDNHDLNERFHNAQYPSQTRVALACLMTLQGIPCIYYGTEQELDGRGDRREYVREALWGRPDAFSTNRELYKTIRELSALRRKEPALRFGRQYFRACSGNGDDFGYSPYRGGVLAYSRILNDRELLVVANTDTQQPASVHVVIDHSLDAEGTKDWHVLFPAAQQSAAPRRSTLHGELRAVQVTLGPMETQVLG
jgi:glycosidase